MLALPVVTRAQPGPTFDALFPVKPQWSVTLEAGLGGRPIFEGTRAFVPLLGDRLATYDLVVGRELWNISQPAPETMVAGEGLVVLASGTTLTALAADDGEPRWTAPLDGPLSAPPVLRAGWLVLAGDAGISARRVDDGSLVWTRAVGATVVHPPTLEGRLVYVAADDHRVVALRIEDGGVAWERRLGGAPQPILARSDRLYVGSADNYFYCLRANDGQVIWRWRTGADLVGLAAQDESRVYFASKDNVLRGLDAGSGAQRWKTALSLRPTSGPVRGKETLLVSGLGATVLGFHLKDGKSAGEFDAGGLLAAPPHLVTAPSLMGPLIVTITRSVPTGTKMSAMTRDFEPPASPMAPLPNPVPVEPLPGGARPTDPGSPDPSEGAPAEPVPEKGTEKEPEAGLKRPSR